MFVMCFFFLLVISYLIIGYQIMLGVFLSFSGILVLLKTMLVPPSQWYIYPIHKAPSFLYTYILIQSLTMLCKALEIRIPAINKSSLSFSKKKKSNLSKKEKKKKNYRSVKFLRGLSENRTSEYVWIFIYLFIFTATCIHICIFSLSGYMYS